MAALDVLSMAAKEYHRRASRSGGHMRWVWLGALGGFISVATGAFGAHALKARVAPDLLAVFETGARYQTYHALALVLVGLLQVVRPAMVLDGAGWSFVLGTVLFSGSLYVLALTGVRAFGMVTPFGGVALLAGWLVLAVAAFKGAE
jgi:uncharacterized membrane protein YgdD (TMEM256/DUF423 family)